jgi:DNA-binding GntR family transcriptional regulator
LLYSILNVKLQRTMKTPAPVSSSALTALKRELRQRRPGSGPRYRQLRDALVATIDGGHWSAGDQLPTEASLYEATPFSLGTVQRALRELVDEGVVVRVQGSGTFVAATYGKVNEVAFCRFLGDDGRTLLPVYTRVRSRARLKGHGPWSTHFAGSHAKPMLLTRMLDVNGEFEVFNRFYFDAARFPLLASRPIQELAGANLKELLRDELRGASIGIEERLAIAKLPDEACASLKLPAGATGGILDGIGRMREEVVYYQQMFIPPSRRQWVPYTAAVAG